MTSGAGEVRSQFFNERGDFAAIRAAEAWLTARGFSYGRMQRGSPRGILFGDFDIQKWRNLRPDDRKALHGSMIGGRDGPVAVRLNTNAPREAILAWDSPTPNQDQMRKGGEDE